MISKWFDQENPLKWILSLSDSDFDDLNRATNPELLQILFSELTQIDTPMLFDGGLTHPAILTELVPSSQIVCLSTTPMDAEELWNTFPKRLEMKEMVKNAQASWERFHECDKLISQTMEDESQAHCIKIFPKSGTPESMAKKIITHLGL